MIADRALSVTSGAPRAPVPLATSRSRLCLLSDGRRIIETGSTDRFHLPFIDNRTPTPIGLYTVSTDGAGASLYLDGILVSDALGDSEAARACARDHYADIAVTAANHGRYPAP